MNFGQAISSGFRNYVGFTGRACRSEFWYWTLFTVVGSICLSILDTAVFPQILWSPLGTVFSVALLLPSLAVMVRRVPDVDKSGWFVLLIFIPVIGWIILLVWELRKGDEGDNRFGVDPLGAPAEESIQS